MSVAALPPAIRPPALSAGARDAGLGRAARRLAAVPLDQQFWYLGLDERRADSKALLAYGFYRVRPFALRGPRRADWGGDRRRAPGYGDPRGLAALVRSGAAAAVRARAAHALRGAGPRAVGAGGVLADPTSAASADVRWAAVVALGDVGSTPPPCSRGVELPGAGRGRES